MGIDIRVPLGAMFTMLGALLAAFGLWGNKAIYSQTLGIDVNLDWGVVLLIFGVIMLVMGLRAPAAAPSSSDASSEPPRPGH